MRNNNLIKNVIKNNNYKKKILNLNSKQHTTKSVKNVKNKHYVNDQVINFKKDSQNERLNYISKINNVLLNKNFLDQGSLIVKNQKKTDTKLNEHILNDFLQNSVNNVVSCKNKKDNKNIDLLKSEIDTSLSSSLKPVKELYSINDDKTIFLLSNTNAVSDTGSMNFVPSIENKTQKRSEFKGLSEENFNWVLFKRMQSIHPDNYLNVLGHRNNKVVLNPNVTLQGIRRCLHYLKNVVEVKNNVKGSSELIIVLESSLLNSLSLQYKSLNKKENLNKSLDKKNSQTKGFCGSTDLLAYSLLRLQKTHLSKLKITLKSAKETLSYLSEMNKNSNKHKLCGVLMINPAKSLLGNLADNIFNQTSKKTKKVSTGNAIGSLCATKGIPLISLCDVVSSLQFCTYPIICDTRNINNIYVVFDLLTYGLNQIMFYDLKK